MHAVHPLLHQRVQQHQHDAGADRDGREDQEEDRHRVLVGDRVDVGAGGAGDLVGDRGVQEPDAEHQAQQARRRQLGDVGQAHRRQAELAHGVEQVGDAQVDHADLGGLGALRDAGGAIGQHREAQTQQHQADAELDRAGRVPVLLPELGEQRRQHDDEQAVQHAEPGGGHLGLVHRELAAQHPQAQAPDDREGRGERQVGQQVVAAGRAIELEQQPRQDGGRDQRHRGVDHLERKAGRADQRAVGVVGREDGHRAAGLLEGEPEEDREEREHEDGLEPVGHDVRRGVIALFLDHLLGCVDLVADAAEQALAEPELNGAEDHEQAGQTEAQVPRDLLADVAAQRDAEEGTGVHAHVEQRVAAVALALIAGAVELADDGRDVRLEQAGAQHDQAQARVERRHRLHEQRDVAGRDDEAAQQHRAPRAQQPVRDVAAQDGRQVDQAGVPAVQAGRLGAGPAPAALAGLGDQEEHEQRPHAVVGEALPHLREEEDEELAGLAEDGCTL
mmetsp:Transcript_122285/g.341140  ORF Transcript_122285/g.341140 Transcript_122285/m.341140 type:complete len:504 (-) Transcript_122285:7-1518(-)